MGRSSAAPIRGFIVRPTMFRVISAAMLAPSVVGKARQHPSAFQMYQVRVAPTATARRSELPAGLVSTTFAPFHHAAIVKLAPTANVSAARQRDMPAVTTTTSASNVAPPRNAGPISTAISTFASRVRRMDAFPAVSHLVSKVQATGSTVAARPVAPMTTAAPVRSASKARVVVVRKLGSNVSVAPAVNAATRPSADRITTARGTSA